MSNAAKTTTFHPTDRTSSENIGAGVGEGEHLRLKMGELLGQNLKERLYGVAVSRSETLGGHVANLRKELPNLARKILNNDWRSTVAAFSAGLASGTLARVILGKPKEKTPDRYSAAVSAVTGGFPEDMNESPADTDIHSDRTVYDGSDLEIKHQKFKK